MKKRLFFISFEEAQHICDKAQYNEATGWEKLKLGLRYLLCRFTRKYLKNNAQLTEVIQNSEIHCLRPEELHSMKAKFQGYLENEIKN